MCRTILSHSLGLIRDDIHALTAQEQGEVSQSLDASYPDYTLCSTLEIPPEPWDHDDIPIVQDDEDASDGDDDGGKSQEEDEDNNMKQILVAFKPRTSLSQRRFVDAIIYSGGDQGVDILVASFFVRVPGAFVKM